jgi:hypothetical protein
MEVLLMGSQSDNMSDAELGMWFFAILTGFWLLTGYGAYRYGYSFVEVAKLRAENQCQHEKIEEYENILNQMKSHTVQSK